MSDSECNSNTDVSLENDSFSDLEMEMENNDEQYLSDAGNLLENFASFITGPIIFCTVTQI